jgi:cytochrome c biogenesis protein CcmG, thiol:disulfide interchange protein DsbE
LRALLAAHLVGFRAMNRGAWMVPLALTACTSARPALTPAEPLSNEPVVGRSVYDLDLKPLGPRNGVRLSEFQGKALLLNVWASWCAPCKEELPRLDDTAPRLRTKGIEIVGASVDESTRDAEEFLHRRDAWTIALGIDPGGRVLRERLGVPRMPTSYVIDRKGVVREVHPGSDQEDFRGIESRLIELAGLP